MVKQDYNLSEVVELLRSCAETHCIADIPPLKELMRAGMVRFLKKLDTDRLKNFALMFMEDCFQVCNVSHYYNKLDPEHTQFNLNLREFRRDRPWLADNLKKNDLFDRIPEKEKSIFYGVRYSYRKKEGVAVISHLEGEATTLDVWELLGLEKEKWQVAIASPGLKTDDLSHLNLKHSQALLLTKV